MSRGRNLGPFGNWAVWTVLHLVGAAFCGWIPVGIFITLVWPYGPFAPTASLIPVAWLWCTAIWAVPASVAVAVHEWRESRRERRELEARFAERMRTGAHRVTILPPPSFLRGVSALDAADTLARNMRAALGVPEPLPRPFEPAGRCLRCGEFGTHLLGGRDTTTYSTVAGTAGPSIDRECMGCGHTWKERLDG